VRSKKGKKISYFLIPTSYLYFIKLRVLRVLRGLYIYQTNYLSKTNIKFIQLDQILEIIRAK
jgi:hypothetical protein